MKNANFAPEGLTQILKDPRTYRDPRECTSTLKHPNFAFLAQGRQGRQEG